MDKLTSLTSDLDRALKSLTSVINEEKTDITRDASDGIKRVERLDVLTFLNKRAALRLVPRERLELSRL